MRAPIGRQHVPTAVAVAAFVATRLWLLCAYAPAYSDMDVYRHYAVVDAAAARTGQSLWQATAQGYEQARAAAEQRGIPPPLLETRIVEYPPLGLLPIIAAAHLSPPGTDGWRERYAHTFRAELFLVDAVAFLLLWRWTSRLHARRALRLALYVGGGAVLCDFLYDRLDLVVGGLVVGALALLVGRRHVAWAWLLLGLAAAYKLVPIALIPIFAVGSLPASAIASGRGLSRFGVIRGLAWCTGGLALVGVALASPALVWGRTAVSFLGYHAARGLQIESPLASLLLVLARAASMPYAVQRHFGAHELVAPAAPEVAASSTLLVALATIVSTLWLVRALAADPPAGGGRLAEQRPQLFVEAAVLTLLSTMCVSKVLSPQYLLWLVPLVPLVRSVRLGIAFVAVAALTTLICPHLYQTDILRMVAGTFPPAGLGPTGLGVALLVARNAALVALAVSVARGMTHAGAAT